MYMNFTWYFEFSKFFSGIGCGLLRLNGFLRIKDDYIISLTPPPLPPTPVSDP